MDKNCLDAWSLLNCYVNSNWLLNACVAVVDEYEDANECEEAVRMQQMSKDIDVDLKVIVPTGFVLAVDRLNPSHVIWQQKVCWIAFLSAMVFCDTLFKLHHGHSHWHCFLLYNSL